MKSFAPVNEKEFDTAGLYIFGGPSLIMAMALLQNSKIIAVPVR